MIVTGKANVIKVMKSNGKYTIPDFAKAVGIIIFIAVFRKYERILPYGYTALLTDDQNVT